MSPDNKSCCGSIQVKLVFTCSGASDVGSISDQAARRVACSKRAFMSCIAAIGAQIPDIVDGVRACPRIVAIDGCERECARLCLDKAGLTNYFHLQLGSMGMEKGKTPPTEERVQQVADRAIELLTAPAPERAQP